MGTFGTGGKKWPLSLHPVILGHVWSPTWSLRDQWCAPIRLRVVDHLLEGLIGLLGAREIRLVVNMLAQVRHAMGVLDGVEEGDRCKALPCHELTDNAVSAAPGRLHVAQTRVKVSAHLGDASERRIGLARARSHMPLDVTDGQVVRPRHEG